MSLLSSSLCWLWGQPNFPLKHENSIALQTRLKSFTTVSHCECRPRLPFVFPPAMKSGCSGLFVQDLHSVSSSQGRLYVQFILGMIAADRELGKRQTKQDAHGRRVNAGNIASALNLQWWLQTVTCILGIPLWGFAFSSRWERWRCGRAVSSTTLLDATAWGTDIEPGLLLLVATLLLSCLAPVCAIPAQTSLLPGEETVQVEGWPSHWAGSESLEAGWYLLWCSCSQH